MTGAAKRRQRARSARRLKEAQEAAAAQDPLTMRHQTSGTHGPKREGRGGGGLWELLHLKDMVTSAKGRATDLVVDFIKNNLLDTKLIFVFGKTGAGKSSLLKELTGMNVKVGNTLESGTRNYEICPGYIHDEKYIFIDTPGFGAADMNNEETMKDIMSCLMILGPFVTISGALFVYDACSDRLTQDEERTIRWLQCFCGPDFFRNITVVITKWDKLSTKAAAKAQARIDALFQNASDNDTLAEDDMQTTTSISSSSSSNSLHNLVHPPPPYLGAHIYHHGLLYQPTSGSTNPTNLEPLDMEVDVGLRRDRAQDMIHARYATTSTPPARLQIQQEMDNFTPLGETQAMKVLLAGDMTRTRVCINKGKAIVVDIPTREGNDNDEGKHGNDIHTPDTDTDSGASIPVYASGSSSKTAVADEKHKDRDDQNRDDDDNKAQVARLKWIEDVGAQPQGGRFWEWFGIAGKMAMFFSQAVGQGFVGMAIHCVEEIKKWFS